ncbi:hypothetical protein Cantr_05041 [Candida viswanathii]|uniref:DUF7082 domain-containing protein n=1 Tax=Candida viswanathii TaxID=5486 RepID=A0A367XQ43_9ASCO|nr:hypothetical protein Cantr_05041 [Candida viswanathii]
MFISSSPRLLPSNRFDMLDPIDHIQHNSNTSNTTSSNTNNSNTNQDFSTHQDLHHDQQQQQHHLTMQQGPTFPMPQVEEDLEFQGQHQQATAAAAAAAAAAAQPLLYQYQPQQPFMSTSNYLLDESSFNNDDNQGLDLESNATSSTTNFYGQSINVNLGAVPSNNNYNITNAGQSSYYGTFNPPQPLYQQQSQQFSAGTANSSTSSSLYSFHHQQQQPQEYGFNTPTQSSFSANTPPVQPQQSQQPQPTQPQQQPSTDLYPSSTSMTSFFDPSSNSINQQTINFELNQSYPQPPLSSSSTNFDINYTSSSPVPQFPPSTSLPKASSSTSTATTKSKSRTSSSRQSPLIKKEHDYEALGSDKKLYTNFSKDRYRVVRGVSAGGCSTRPPKESIESDSIFLPVELNLNGASIEDVCYPKWSKLEKEDRRRIIRIERIQNGPKISANFTIVGNANENPITLPPSTPDIDVVEVSCLECDVRINDEYDSQSSDDEITGTSGGKSPNYIKNEVDGEYYQYYITSVEVVEIVELLIGNQFRDAAERRRERGRVRSNLVPFWSKKPISSRMSENSANSPSNNTLNLPGSLPTNHDYRMELAKRIMGYEIRKPRGFDKEVRILRWDKLIPALKRALQSYYTEIPQHDSHLQF